jgi:hypothetical protein
VPYLISKLNYPPIYTTPLTKEIILKRQEEFSHLKKLDIRVIDAEIKNRIELSQEFGLKLCHLVIPEKQSVLPNIRFPHGIQKIGKRPIEQILSINLSICYPLSELKKMYKFSDLYFRGDSHWNVAGAWICFKSLADILWPDKEFDFEVLNITRAYWNLDLVKKFHNDLYEEVFIVNRVGKEVYNNNLNQLTGAHAGNHYVLHNAQAKYNECVVIFGDSYSYSQGFSDIVNHYFSIVHFIWSTQVNFEYCAKVNAKYIIVQSGERFIIRPHIDVRK